jgi:hypothetical protein
MRLVNKTVEGITLETCKEMLTFNKLAGFSPICQTKYLPFISE